jgi:hypothetical protein
MNSHDGRGPTRHGPADEAGRHFRCGLGDDARAAHGIGLGKSGSWELI